MRHCLQPLDPLVEKEAFHESLDHESRPLLELEASSVETLDSHEHALAVEGFLYLFVGQETA